MDLKKFHIPEKEIIIPNRPKTALKKAKTVSNTPRKTNLFQPKNLDQELSTFDVIDPGADQGPHMLNSRSPTLLAIKKKATKVKNDRLQQLTARPKTSLTPSAAQMMPSLLSNHKLSPVKVPRIEEAVQNYQKQVENERSTISFPEDPIAYFSKRKDGRGHRFIYLNYKGNRKDPFFNPYELVKVPFAEINQEYFTMSASGIAHIMPNGQTENLTLDRWTRESSFFITLRKLKMFKLYFWWKPFTLWKSFVMRQRYNQITERAMKYSMINNFVFYQTSFEFVKDPPDSIIIKNLLAFHTQKNYTLDQYLEIQTSNRNILDQGYIEYLNLIVETLLQLDIDIRNPQRLVVDDSEFSEIKRRNPNLGQLKILERKKHAENLRRQGIVKKEVNSFCQFIRATDMLILESLVKSCVEAWKIAEYNVTSDMAAIFEIEVGFDDAGKVVFNPTLQKLLETTKTSLRSSLDHLNELPRLLMARPLRKRLNENIPNLKHLFDTGPNFLSFISCNSLIPQIENNILTVIETSYHDAEVISQVFVDFYPIYKTGLTWDVNHYLEERGGESKLIELFTVDDGCPFFSFDPSTEIIIDFNKVNNDIVRFQNDEIKFSQFHACTVRGALYIDSRKIRSILQPIPSRCINDIRNLLKDLIQKKTTKYISIMKACGRKFNHDPTSLQFFVDYCEFIDKAEMLVPYLSEEIIAVDEMYDLFSLFKDQQIEESPETLHSSFVSFKSDIKEAVEVKNLNSDKYLFLLQQELRKYDSKLQKYYDIATSYPSSIQLTDVDTLIPATTRLKNKIIKLESKIQELLRDEKILNITLNDFSIYQKVKIDIEIMEQVFQCVAKWNSIEKIILSVPFSSIDMNKFKEDLLNLENDVKEIKSKDEPNVILIELGNKLDDIVPFIEPLIQLSSSNMQLLHWYELFENCGQPNAYYSHIKIEDLRSLGILKEFDKIAQITTTSRGESELEIQFKELLLHWQGVTLPLIGLQTDEYLVIGSLKDTFNDIADTQITLYNMLHSRFVQGFRENVLQLSNNLERCSLILETWQNFQIDFLIIYPIFTNNELKGLLPQQTSKFQMVKRRWVSLIKHTREDTNLFKVCSFPQLYEMLSENNKTLEAILSSLVKFIDTKRDLVPRLYFLSNDEVLSLISTNDFSIFSSILTNIFMNIYNFDARKNDLSNEISITQNFSRMRIYGLVTEDGDSFSFNEYVSCLGNLEEWLPKLYDEIKSSVKSNLADSLAKYQSGNMNDWVLAFNTFIVILTLQISFCRDIEECFSNIDSNARAFSNYENVIQQRIQEMSVLMQSPLAKVDLIKLSSVITLFNYYLMKTRSLSEKYAYQSQRMNWLNHLRLTFDLNNSSIFVHFQENQCEHGYEYFGSSLQFIHTPSSERAMMNILNNSQNSMLIGSNGIGKRHLLQYIAANYGQFIYFASSFPDYSYNLFSRLLIGTATSGSWLCFLNIENQHYDKLSFLYDNLRNLSSVINSGGTRININAKIIEIHKSTRFFATYNLSSTVAEELPIQLKSLLKPIAYASLDVRLLAEIKFKSQGFKSTKHLSVKLTSLLQTLSESFTDLLIKQQTKVIIKIIDKATAFLREMMHSKGNTFINYYESSRTVEEFCCARSIYETFGHNIKENEKQSFFTLIYSTFTILENLNKFTKHLINPHCFEDEQDDQLLRNELIKFTNNEYLINQTIALFKLLLTNSCVIICGESNTGKSYIVELLSKVFENLSKNAELINKFKGLAPIKLLDLFMNIENNQTIFGHSVDDRMFGCIQLNGYLNSFLNELNEYTKSNHGFVRFNGMLTNEFVKYLIGILDNDKEKGRLNSLDNFSFNQRLHFLIETDSLESISPSLLPLCGLIYMRNQNNIKDNFIINEAFQKNLKLDQTTIEKAQKIISEISPIIIKFVSSNNFQSYSKNSSNLLHHIYSLCLCYLSNNGYTTEKQIKTVAVISFFIVYSNILHQNDIKSLESFLIKQFSIQLSDDWSGNNLPDQFWAVYPKPSLSSTVYFRETFIPVNFTSIKDKKPILKKTDRQFSLISDLSICTAEYLQPLYIMQMMSKYQRHFLVYGNNQKHFLNCFFDQNSEITPIYIPIGPESNNRSISSFIQLHSSCLQKRYFMLPETKIFALIFDLTTINLNVIEFIRMIIQTKKIPKINQNNSKFFELLDIRNFFVIVIGRNIDEFPTRFTSLLTPIHVNVTSQTHKYIYNTISAFYGLDQEFIDRSFSLISSLSFDYLKPLEILSQLNDKSNQKILRLTLLNELGRTEKVETAYKKVFKTKSDIETLESFNRNYISTNINMASNMSSFVIRLNEKSYKGMKIDLTANLMVYNKKFEPIQLEFTKFNFEKIVQLERTICYPGSNVILIGNPGMNRKTLTKFVALIKDFSFLDLNLNVIDSIKEALNLIISLSTNYVFYISPTNDNQREMELVLNLLKTRDFSYFYSPAELFNLYLKTNRAATQDQYQNLITYNQLLDLITNKIHIVISIDQDRYIKANQLDDDQISFKNDLNNESQDNKLLNDYLFNNNLYQISFNLDKIEDFEDIVNCSLNDLNQIMKMPDKLPHLMAKIHLYVKEIYLNLPLNYFYDFIFEFSRKLAQTKEDFINKHQQTTDALDFMNSLNDEMIELDRELKLLGPELEKLNQTTSEMESQFTEKSETVEKRQNELQEEEMLKRAELNQIQDELSQFKAQLIIEEGNIQTNLCKVEQLQEKDIKILQLTAESPSNLYKNFFETLAILLEMPGEYQPYGFSLATDMNIVQTMTNRLYYKNIPNDVFISVNNNFKANDFNHENMETIAPALGVIFDWINSIYAYTNLKQKIQLQQTKLDDKQNEYNVYLQETKSERDIVNQTYKNLQAEIEVIKNQKEEKEKLEKEFAEKETRRRNINHVIKNSWRITEKWQRDLNQFDDELKLMIGNTIVYASYLVYCGMLNQEQKKSLLAFISNEMERNLISSSNDSFMYYVASHLEMSDDVKTSSKDNHSFETARDFHHIRIVHRTPLIIDSNQIIYSFICDKTPKEKLLKISMINSDFEAKVRESIDSPAVLLISDVNYLTPFLETLLKGLLIDRTYDQKKIHPEFRLFLFTSKKSFEQIPLDLITNVCFINTDNLATANDSICNCFVNYYDHEMISRLTSVNLHETYYRIEMMRYEQQLFAKIANIKQLDSDFLNNEQAYGELLEAKGLLSMTLNVTIDVNTLKNEQKMAIEPFSKHINFCEAIWEAINKYLVLINSNYAITLNRFLSLIKTGISQSGVKPGILNDDDYNKLLNSLRIVLMKGLLTSLSFTESLFVMFISSFIIERRDAIDLKDIAKHFAEEYHSKCSFKKTNANSDDMIELLKYANISELFKYITDYISIHFTNEFGTFLPIFQVDSFVSGSHLTPVIIQSDHSTTLLMEHFATMRNRIDSFELYTLYDDDDSLTRIYTDVVSSFAHGTWIALLYTNKSMKAAKTIADIYSALINDKSKVTMNFRLIILANTIEYLPVDLLLSSSRVNIDSYPSIRHQMYEVYLNHSASLRSTTNPKLMKKMSYTITLLCSMINFSTFIKPFGLFEFNQIDEMTVKEAIDYLRNIIDTHSINDIPFRNVRDTIQDTLYGINCVDTFDRRKLRSLVYSLVTPDILDDDFSFIDPLSDESEYWSIPPDAPITNYAHVIEKLPVFTTCDVIMMSRYTSDPIRMWNLSRWISTPFMKLNAPLQNSTFSKVEQIKKLIPEKIVQFDGVVKTPIMKFIITEIEYFNSALDAVMDTLNQGNLPTVVPKEWREKVGYSGTINLQRFLGLLEEKSKFYKKILNQKVILDGIDCRLIRSIKGLLLAFLHQVAFDKSISVDNMIYEFDFTEYPKPSSSSLVLNNLYMCAGSYNLTEKSLERISNTTSPFTKMPSLCCFATKRTTKTTKVFQCPLFTSLPQHDENNEFMLSQQKERFDGEINNFVWYIPLKTDITDKQCMTEGTCLICHLPDIFQS